MAGPYDQEALPEVAMNAPAAPVDTFVQGQKPQDLTPNLTSLANGLSQLDSGLASFVEERKQKQDQEDALRGEIDFHKNNEMGYDEATKQGLVPAFASRSYMLSYQKQQGMVAGEDLQQKYDDAYQQAGGGNMTPDQFRTFTSGFISSNLGNTQQPGVLAGLAPKVQQLAKRGDMNYTRDHDAVTRQNAYNVTGANMSQTLDSANADGLQNKTGPNYDAAFATIMEARGDYVKRNSPDAGDKLAIDTIAAKSVELRDPKLLDMLNRNVPGTSYTFADTPYGRAVYDKTQNRLLEMGRQAIAQDAAAQKQADKVASDSITSTAMDALAKDPSAPLDENILVQGSKYNPKFREDMVKAQNTFLSAQGKEDPQAILQVNQDIINGGGREAVNKAVQSGIIRSSKTLENLNTQADNYVKNRSVVDNILADPTYKSFEGAIKNRLGSDLNNPLEPKGDTPETMQLKGAMSQAVLNWATNHPGATPQDKQKAINDIGQLYLGSIQGAENSMPTTKPVDQAAVQALTGPAPTAMTPFSGKGTPGALATPAPSNVLPQAPPVAKPIQVDPEQLKAFQQSLTPAQLQVLQGRATAAGRSVDDVVKDIYTNAVRGGHITPTPGDVSKATAPAQPQLRRMSAPDGGDAQGAITNALAGPDDAAQKPQALAYSEDDAKKLSTDFTNGLNTADSATVQRTADAFTQALNSSDSGPAPQGGYSIATLRNDPKAARILDFVAGPESSGNYNAYFGHAGSTKDLSQMSLSDIRNFMHNRGTVSSATGRYQFMEATLFGANGKPGLVQRMGLSMHDKFTPVLQDTLAIQLLKDRGYDDWKAGRMSTDQFANNLAHEWASLPMPNGRSAYAGDGLNKSLVSRQDLLATLKHPEKVLQQAKQVADYVPRHDGTGVPVPPIKPLPTE